MPGTASFRTALEDALPERPFRVVLWDGSEVPPPQPNCGPTFTAPSPQALAHVLRAPGELGLGRAYVTGAIDVDDLDAVVKVVDTWQPPPLDRRTKAKLPLAALRAPRPRPRPQAQARSRRAAPPGRRPPAGAAVVRAPAQGALPLDRARLARG